MSENLESGEHELYLIHILNKCRLFDKALKVLIQKDGSKLLMLNRKKSSLQILDKMYSRTRYNLTKKDKAFSLINCEKQDEISNTTYIDTNF